MPTPRVRPQLCRGAPELPQVRPPGVANLATLVPSSPGYVGPFEYGVQIALNGALGVEKEMALSYAIVVHATLYFPITVWGAIEWWRQNLSLRQVRELENELDSNGGTTSTV